MRRSIQIIFFMVILFFSGRAITAQNISGTVNTYTNVTAISSNVVTVGSVAGLSVGDKVLLIQMKGATITTGNIAAFGNITAYGNAGNYEYLTVASIAGNNVTMTTNLCQTYTISGAVQLIRVPVYTSPTITGAITCTPWNGTIGGVVAFEATGTVTFNANINVAGSGFRGGIVGNGAFICNDPNYADIGKGQKGEGIAVAPAGQIANRASLANGGGGANTGNPGAGGGANYGAGGRGGNEFPGQCVTTSYGLGGHPLTMNSSKIFMGGGGGGGYQDNGLACQPGTNGGGLIFIKAPTISGNNFSINANGLNVVGNSDSEGAGAGGAGGAVYLWTNSVTSQLNVNVRGGNGGNILSTFWASSAHGPGGGGGGGYAWFNSAALPANVTVNTTGGAPGLVLHAGAWFNTPFGATSGQPGATLFNLPVPASPSPFANLGNDTTICAGQTLTLQTSTTYTSYTWSTGAVTPTINVSATGTYWVDVPVGCGAIDRDSIVVTVGTASVNIGPDQSFCQGDSAHFIAGAGFSNYTWNTGDNTSDIYANTIGTYIVTVTDAVGCTDSDTADILNIYPLPVVNLGPDTAQCGGSVLLNAGAGFTNYLWQNGVITNNFNANITGTYWVLVTDANTCYDYDSVLVTIHPIPNPNLGPDISFCTGQNAILNPGTFAGYLWNTGATSQTIQVTTAGTYSVSVTNAVGCTDTDTLVVQNVYPLPNPNLGIDQSFCNGNTIVLNPGTFTTYQWQNGSSLPTFQVSATGNYFVQVTDNNNCQNADTVNITVFPLPTFSLGLDLKICPGDNIEIFPNGPSAPVTYLWNDNSTGQSLIIYNVGTYYLIVTDNNLCNFTDTIEVINNCPPTIYIPNAFTPNIDEINPLFKAYGTNVKVYRMDIYDRWGKLIYTLNGINEGWDGNINGREAPIGQYVYKVTYQDFLKADDIYITGGFLLIR